MKSASYWNKVSIMYLSIIVVNLVRVTSWTVLPGYRRRRPCLPWTMFLVCGCAVANLLLRGRGIECTGCWHGVYKINGVHIFRGTAKLHNILQQSDLQHPNAFGFAFEVVVHIFDFTATKKSNTEGYWLLDWIHHTSYRITCSCERTCWKVQSRKRKYFTRSNFVHTLALQHTMHTSVANTYLCLKLWKEIVRREAMRFNHCAKTISQYTILLHWFSNLLG